MCTVGNVHGPTFSQSAEGFDIRFHPMTALVGTTTTSKRVILAGSRLHALQAEAVDDPVTSDHTVMVGLGFSDASLSFAAASAHVVKVWDAESGKLLRLYRSPTASEITRMCPTKDGRLFAVSDAGGAVSVTSPFHL